MESGDLTILQRMVQRIGGLEKRVTLVEDSQNNASRRLYRIEAGITDLSVRFADLSERFAVMEQRFANVEILLAKIATRSSLYQVPMTRTCPVTARSAAMRQSRGASAVLAVLDRHAAKKRLAMTA